MTACRPPGDGEPGGPVVVGGAAAVDEILFVAGTLGDGKARIVRREQRFGGNAVVAVLAAAAAGAATVFAGHLPDEHTEPGLLARLRAGGVDLSKATYSPATRAIRSTILVGSDGNRFIAFDDETLLGLPEDLDLDVVRTAGALLLDAYGVPGGIRAAAAAREAGVPVVVDIEFASHPRISELLTLAGHLVLPIGFAQELTGETSPDKVVAALWRPDRQAVVLTAGASGTWYRGASGPALAHRPAVEVDVVDTTGCGDVFHGAYAAALAGGVSLDGCVEAATLGAADCAARPGGVPPLTRQNIHSDT
ncbi:PfkB family carbohydrate kinase [Amycolatopsis pigmentata]|uniref:PfkB family carbohydrate kinase n=1 Tax=Amycolatopsis pigmentata TaxID=450801 RepID=A0ABW5FKK1_9PSEU